MTGRPTATQPDLGPNPAARRSPGSTVTSIWRRSNAAPPDGLPSRRSSGSRPSCAAMGDPERSFPSSTSPGPTARPRRRGCARRCSQPRAFGRHVHEPAPRRAERAASRWNGEPISDDDLARACSRPTRGLRADRTGMRADLVRARDGRRLRFFARRRGRRRGRRGGARRPYDARTSPTATSPSSRTSSSTTSRSSGPGPRSLRRRRAS